MTNGLIHPQWRGQNTRTIVANDIAIVKLASSAAALGAAMREPTNSLVTIQRIAGYGQTNVVMQEIAQHLRNCSCTNMRSRRQTADLNDIGLCPGNS